MGCTAARRRAAARARFESGAFTRADYGAPLVSLTVFDGLLRFLCKSSEVACCWAGPPLRESRQFLLGDLRIYLTFGRLDGSRWRPKTRNGGLSLGAKTRERPHHEFDPQHQDPRGWMLSFC